MTDKTMVEILNNHFVAIVEEMGFTILRTGHTVFIKETGDFGTALISPEGEVFAAPLRVGMIRNVGLPTKKAIAAMTRRQSGDVWISNDPVSTGGMSSHLPDLFLWKAIVQDEEPICYVMAFIHVTDIGGRVPGSIGPLSSEIYQEGLRIPPSRLYKDGELNQELVNIILANCRIPEQNWGDLQAAISALHRGEKRVLELVDHFGLQTFKKAISDVLDYAEDRARQLFKRIPNGDYEFSDYLEAGSITERPLWIQAKTRVRGSEIEIDFTGSDPQAPTAFNLPSGGDPRHCFLVQAPVIYLRTVDKDLPYNSGLVRPVTCRTSQGSLLNPDPDAAVGIRAVTMHRVSDVVMGCLAAACPDVVPVAGSGGGTIVLLSAESPEGRTVSVVEPVTGGSGGRPGLDGVNGCDIIGSTGRNIPVEVLEDELPVFVHRYGLRPSSGGAGKYRGGLSTEFTFELQAPKGKITARGMERRRFRPWGRAGGQPGQLGEVKVVTAKGDVRDEPRLDVVDMEAGDVITFLAASGGGLGDPLKRDPEKVLEDILDGYLLPEDAERDYGVLVRAGVVDQIGTESLRADSAAGRPSPSDVSFGQERIAFEKDWPVDIIQVANESLGKISGSLRYHIRERVLATWRKAIETGGDPDLQELLAEIFKPKGKSDR